MKWAILSIVSLLVFGFIAYSIYHYIYRQDKLLGGIALSEDDQYIAFAYQKNGKPAVYVAKSDGTDAKKIIDTKENSWGWAPIVSFNPNGYQVLIIDYDFTGQKPNSILEIVDLDSKNTKIIPTAGIFATEAIFSSDGKTIYIIGASYFGSSSFFTRNRPRDFDLYSIRTDGSDMKQLTNDKAFAINSLNIPKEGKFLTMHYSWGDKINLISIDNPKKIQTLGLPLNLSETSDSSRTDNIDLNNITMIDYVKFAPNYKTVFFTSNKDNKNGTYKYELYGMDSSTKQITTLTNLKSNVINPILFNNQKKILFLQQTNWPNNNPYLNPNLYQLMKVNTDGTGLEKINLSV